MGFGKAIPRELEEVAMIDGLSRFGTFVKLTIPVSIAGILAVVVFDVYPGDTRIICALTFITWSREYTVRVGVPPFWCAAMSTLWGSLMAACLTASAPIAIIYNWFVDRPIGGFTVGAVK